MPRIFSCWSKGCFFKEIYEWWRIPGREKLSPGREKGICGARSFFVFSKKGVYSVAPHFSFFLPVFVSRKFEEKSQVSFAATTKHYRWNVDNNLLRRKGPSVRAEQLGRERGVGNFVNRRESMKRQAIVPAAGAVVL